MIFRSKGLNICLRFSKTNLRMFFPITFDGGNFIVESQTLNLA